MECTRPRDLDAERRGPTVDGASSSSSARFTSRVPSAARTVYRAAIDHGAFSSAADSPPTVNADARDIDQHRGGPDGCVQ